jgi:lipopolysaccharide/colanic/teichoic acid biosynthesis glycosyltransferase
VGPAWIGAGRSIERGASVLGPAALWDDPGRRPHAGRVVWSDLEPTQSLATVSQTAPAPRPRGVAKRIFDIAFASLALLFTLPLYPFVMLAIWLEDGRPFFFAHGRETVGGKAFGCIKFRSMRKDAERVKAELAKANQADGPQFYMHDDPRLTRVGRFIRKANIDELPQFINVLLGHMSVVGPRPSPYTENQFCPSWREARLSVRPGITGLWQVRRTRRPGLDFQEWIRYDLEYVRTGNWRMDLMIIAKTIRLILGA